MALIPEIESQLRRFLRQTDFGANGGVITDLDGTAVHEYQGRITIPRVVEHGLKHLYDLGRPLILNSLRFPLSVLRTFGRDWYRISNAPIPTVSMNGSLLGYVTQSAAGEPEFEEITAFPLTSADIEEILQGVEGLIDGGIRDLLVFYYPRNWRAGELIWTPAPERVGSVREKYVSADTVTAVEYDKLREQLLAQDVCMIFLLIDAPEDTLMAYQHSKRSNFFTHKGVDKLSGAQQIAEALGIDLLHSIGAGDTEMDRFLEGVALAVHVGPFSLPYRGRLETIRLSNSLELGELLFRLVSLHREAQQ